MLESYYINRLADAIRLHSCLRLIWVAVLWLSFLSVKAQQPVTDKLIDVNYQKVPLKIVLDDITQKSGLQFSYNPKVIPLDSLITYQATQTKINALIDAIFHQAGIQYEFIENHIVLKPAKVLDVPKEKEPEKPQTFTISGYVTDIKNQEALIGANVYIEETGVGTTTNNYGYFSLTLPQGEYKLHTSYLGYGMNSDAIQLYKNFRWNINLEPVASVVDEIVVSSSEREALLLNSLAAQINIKPFEVKKQTAALGETDLLKSFDNLPGISFQSDGSSYFYVRGGNRDQNLILLDEAPIYNPSHMLGLFTPIIPDVVKTTSIYKADFPIQFGGRLSSIIDIRTRDGNMEKFSGSTSLGVVAGHLSFEGPIKKQKSSYFVSFRRSYLGALLKAAQPNINTFYFSDFTTKFNFRLGKKDRLFITLYSGNDKFINEESKSIANGLEWGNSSLTLRWNHLFGERLFANTTFYTSKYNYYLHTDYERNLFWNSHISSTHLQSEFSYFKNPQNQLNYGIKLGTYYFNPGNYNAPGISIEHTVSPNNSLEFIIYAGHEWNITHKLQLNTGFRLTRWSNSGEAFIVEYQQYEPVDYKTYKKGERYYLSNSWEPRISVGYKTGDYSSIKASYNRTLQHINLINNSISPFNTLEVWLPSGPNIKPQQADIYNLGFVNSWPDKTIELTLDVFYKKLYNQIGYSYHASTLLNPLLEGELRQGNGKAYGFEVLIKKTQGRFTGQLGYSFTRSLLLINGLNGNREYKARQDKPIDFSLGLGYSIKPRWLLTSNFLYSSGMMITTPTAFYYYRGSQVPVYTAQNNDRLPNYKRLDLGMDFKLNKSQGSFEHHLLVSVYNFFNYQNPAFLYFTKTTDADGQLVIPTDKQNYQELTPTYRYIYSVIPSLTYTLKF